MLRDILIVHKVNVNNMNSKDFQDGYLYIITVNNVSQYFTIIKTT